MTQSQKTAIILGATGLTGDLLLKKLLSDVRYKKIKVFTRRPLEITNSKLEEVQCDLLELEKVKDEFKADEVFCCIGTTAKKTPNKDTYRRIEYGIPLNAAKICKENGINTIIVISALGANASSPIFYNRTKGEMEKAVLAQDIKHTFLLRPSVINGDRKERRIGEKIGIILTSILQPLLIGKTKKYRTISAEVIAEAMMVLANDGFEKKIVSSEQIQRIATESHSDQ